MNQLESYIYKHAISNPDKIAISCSGQNITYKELHIKINEAATQIAKIPQNALIIRSSQTINFIITYLGAHLAGKPVIPLESDFPESAFLNLSQFIYSSEIPVDIADILFTTGTTGTQKGTMLSHKAIMANAENLIDALRFSPDITFIVCGPLNHIGSLSKIWPSLIIGASIKILDGMRDLDSFFYALQSTPTKIATFLVPASIRIMLQFGKQQLIRLASKIDFIETGAAPIAQSDMDLLCQLLPNTRLYNTYASTETGIIATHNFNDGYCVAGCLGKVMINSQLYVDSNGLIYCKGKTLMSGYIGEPQLTEKVLRNETIYTNDVGEIDSQGRLHLVGRQGDIINIGGYKINPVEIENIVNSYSGITDCICIAAPHPVIGKCLKLLVVLSENKQLDKKSLGLFLRSKLERHKIPQMLSQVESIKRTYNGKLDRKYYQKHLN